MAGTSTLPRRLPACLPARHPCRSPTPIGPALARRCAALARVLRQARSAPLLSMAVAEATAAVVCEPGCRTTDQETMHAVLQVGIRRGVGTLLCRCLPPSGGWCSASHAVRLGSRASPGLTPPPARPPACLACSLGPLQETAALGRPLFSLFSHPAPRVAHVAALIMQAVAGGGAEAAQPMREAALTGGWVGGCGIR